jgi:hypothetical protein
MLKREFAFAVIAAAMLTVGTVRAAVAQADCFTACMNAFGPSFRTPVRIIDDFDNVGPAGLYIYSGCADTGSGVICEYTHLG